MGIVEVVVLIVLPVLLWLTSWACVIDEYVIKPGKGLLEGMRDFYREAEECEDYWW